MKRTLVAFKNGRKLDPISITEWNRIMDSFKEGDKLTVTIENYVRKRSLGQNNLFHLLCDFIARHEGWTMADMKRFVKENYGVWEPKYDRNGDEIVNKETGEIFMTLKSTANYTKEETTRLIDGVYDLAARLEIKLPERDDIAHNNIPLI